MGIPRHNDIVERFHAADQQAKCEDAKQCDCFAVPTHCIQLEREVATRKYADAIRKEAEDHAAFFGHPGDAERIAGRESVNRANVAVGYVEYLKPYLQVEG